VDWNASGAALVDLLTADSEERERRQKREELSREEEEAEVARRILCFRFPLFVKFGNNLTFFSGFASADPLWSETFQGRENEESRKTLVYNLTRQGLQPERL
jgi:hypothetical protein